MTESKKTINETYTGLPDARSDKKTQNLLNTHVYRSKSGHVLEMNDNEDGEHVTLQHRSGSMIQMQSDGSVRFVSHNGKMGFEINGEGYMKVTGAYNVMIDGAAAFKISGNMDWTVDGDVTQVVSGSHTMISKSMNVIAAENFDIAAKSMTGNIEDNMSLSAEGEGFIGAKGQMKLASADGDLDLSAASRVGIDGDSVETNAQTITSQASSFTVDADTEINGDTVINGDVALNGGDINISGDLNFSQEG